MFYAFFYFVDEEEVKFLETVSVEDLTKFFKVFWLKDMIT